MITNSTRRFRSRPWGVAFVSMLKISSHRFAPQRFAMLSGLALCTGVLGAVSAGVPLRLLPREIDGVRIIGIDVPGFGVPTHAEAKDVLAGAMLAYARAEAEAGPVQAPRNWVPPARSGKPTVKIGRAHV